MKRIALVLVVVLGVMGVVGVVAMRQFRAAQQAAKPDESAAAVERGDLEVRVVETGTIDAVRAVEVKSRVAGRVARLAVDEGDSVALGDLIAVIDPQETQLRVDQDRAQLRGAESAVARTGVEIEQRRITARTAVDRARARVAQLQKELEAQPILTRSAIRSAETQLASARQALAQLREATLPNARDAAEAAVREAELQLANADREVERRQSLEERGFVSRREVDDARLNRDLAQTRLRNAQAQLGRVAEDHALRIRQAEQTVAAAEADVARARANGVQDEIKRRELDTARAALREAEVGLRDVEVLAAGRAQSQATVDQLRSSLGDSLRQLGETEIRAPFAGVVSRRLIEEGELVASLSSFSSGTPVVRLEDRSRMRVKLEINEIDVARLRVGLPATVEVDAIPNERFQGVVEKIAPSSQSLVAGQAGGGNSPVVKYAVEIRVDRPDERLKSGMTAKCTVITLRRERVLRVPEEYVVREDGKTFLLKAPAAPAGRGPAPKPERIEVKTGVATAGMVEILSGVAEGTRLAKPDFKGPARRGAQFGPGDE